MNVENSTRPRNYEEMADLADAVGMEFARSEFLHLFFGFKDARLFEVPPPARLPRHQRAVLAGAAEYLCQRYDLPVPLWVEDPVFFLPEIWDPWEDLVPDMEETRGERIARTPPAFLRRNVVYEARNLIVL